VECIGGNGVVRIHMERTDNVWLSKVVASIGGYKGLCPLSMLLYIIESNIVLGFMVHVSLIG